MYKALVRFADLKDGKRIYEAGEEYPRPGFVVTPERLNELAGSDNRAGYPLIALISPDKDVPDEHDKLINPKPKTAKKTQSRRQKG